MKKEFLRIRGSRKKLMAPSQRQPKKFKLWTQNLLDNFKIKVNFEPSNMKNRKRNLRKSDVDKWQIPGQVRSKSRQTPNPRAHHVKYTPAKPQNAKNNSNHLKQTRFRRQGPPKTRNSQNQNCNPQNLRKHPQVYQTLQAARQHTSTHKSKYTNNQNSFSTSKCEIRRTNVSGWTKQGQLERRQKSSKAAVKYTSYNEASRGKNFLPFLIAARYRASRPADKKDIGLSQEIVQVLNENVTKKTGSSNWEGTLEQIACTGGNTRRGGQNSSKLVRSIQDGFRKGLVLKRFFEDVDDGARVKKKRGAKAKVLKRQLERCQEGLLRSSAMLAVRKNKFAENLFLGFQYEGVGRVYSGGLFSTDH